jgi:sugar (pentulose or hexulose) kinase
LNRSLYISDEAEITARGTALLAQHAISQKTSLSAAVPHIVKEIEPQPAAVKKLAAARQRQQELYDLLYQ